jgi:hypothetical protein
VAVVAVAGAARRKPTRPAGTEVGASQEVRDHRWKLETDQAKSQQRNEPRLVLRAEGVQQCSDPRNILRDHPSTEECTATSVTTMALRPTDPLETKVPRLDEGHHPCEVTKAPGPPRRA